MILVGFTTGLKTMVFMIVRRDACHAIMNLGRSFDGAGGELDEEMELFWQWEHPPWNPEKIEPKERK